MSSLKYKAILFDLSDTLIEYRPNYAEIYGTRLRKLGFTISDAKADQISKLINNSTNVQIRNEQNGAPHLNESELEAFLDHEVLHFVGDDSISQYQNLRQVPLPKQEILIKQDVFETLDYLKSKYRLGIVSNHKVWMLDYLKQCNLAPYFETIIISDIVGISKPDPKIMKLACDELHLGSRDCLYIGDQPFDVLCAKKAGIDCVLITADHEPIDVGYIEDYRIQTISELKSLL